MSAGLPPLDSLLDEDQRRELTRLMHAERAMEHLRASRPGWFIAPHDHGQLQALCSDHVYRILIPGNGFGKTTTMAMDLDLLMQREDPFKPHMMPANQFGGDGGDRPTSAVWFCQKYQQWEVMRPDVESLLTAGWQWREQKKMYEWPHRNKTERGSRCFVMSSDSDWTAIQGVQIDAVYFDEHPDRKFWNEMLYRRRGKKKTRFMVAATMTQGITWFVTSVIQEWEKYCRAEGLTNQQALSEQPHPTIFLWNVGGIEDNPSMGAEDVKHYESVMTASEKERHVRLKGGYSDFTGEPVFYLPSLLAMEPRQGESGSIIFVPDEDSAEADKLAERRIRSASGGAMGHRFAGAMDQRFFRWLAGVEVEGGRITLYEPPDPDQAGNYVLGADFAAGLVGKDYDAAMVGVKTADGQVRQVAEAHGWWGDVFFAEILYMLGVMYYEAFIVGERQFGLPCLRRLYDEMGYTYLFRQRREDTRARRPSDLLGHHRGIGDTIIPNHRLAIRRRDVALASADAITEHKRYQFQPRRKNDVIDDVERTADLSTGAPSGENDDLVMAAAYMTHAAKEIVHFPQPKRSYKPGTFGDVMGLDKTFSGRRKRDPYAL